jgi:hypothetical protein
VHYIPGVGTAQLIRQQYPHRDSKRVLECLQKALRIANSAIEEIVTVQLYCDTLDKYLYYLDRGAPAVRLYIKHKPAYSDHATGHTEVRQQPRRAHHI